MARSLARGAALAALQKIEEGKFLGEALAESDRRTGEDDRELRLARRIVRGTLKSRGHLDWILGRLLKRGGPGDLDPRIRNILRIGLFQILHLSSIPSHASVNETVRLARAIGGDPASRLVNAILRRVLREGVPEGIPSIEDDPVRHLAISESFPEWLVSRWIRRLGVERTRSRLEAANRPSPLSLRLLDLDKIDEVIDRIALKNNKIARSAIDRHTLRIEGAPSPLTIEPFVEGLMIVQDEGASLAVSLAEPVAPGSSAIDICAAPGGKGLAIASLIGRAGRFIACDRSPRRLKRFRENRDRLGLDWVDMIAADGRAVPFTGRFDLVLLDAPCSGLGTMARHADLRWRVEEDDIQRLGDLSVELLSAAADRVEPGGVLLYSTCTTEPEENEGALARFLESDGRFQVERPAGSYPRGSIAEDGTLHLTPEDHGCDGTFAARLRRRDI